MHTFSEFMQDIQRYNLETILKPFELADNFRRSNGCGAKGGINVPDTMWGVDIQSACHIHDIEWWAAKSFDELLEANERFENNLKLICDPQSNLITKRLRRYRITTYINEVELTGTWAYARERNFITS